MENNKERVKIINTGVKAFTRCDNKGSECDFRIAQEGAVMLLHFINKRRQGLPTCKCKIQQKLSLKYHLRFKNEMFFLSVFLLPWYIRERCARNDQYLLFDLVKAYDKIKSSQKTFFSPKRPIIHHSCATCSDLYLI